jgi:hypothetical protein
MIRVEASTMIDRPIEDVFAFLADFRSEPKFVPPSYGPS